jgi:hypothetical protein
MKEKKKLNEENFKENEEKNLFFLKNVFLNVKENVTKNNNNLNEDDFINKLNLEENEKNLINKILNENKNENIEEKKEKIFYVISNKRDDNDDKLENFLKLFYSKRNVPKIFFKKLSNNNYEYGTEKIMVKFESDLIRVRYSGGYILLDKFLEVNGPIEENESISLSDTNTNIPTMRGTNVLTVDTQVQPSNVYVSSRKESQYETAMRENYEQELSDIESALQEV